MKGKAQLALLAMFARTIHGSPLNQLIKRNSSGGLPSPIVFSPSEEWNGIDGQWNTFALRVGTPPQIVKVMISTTSQQTWAIHPIGCSLDFAGLPSSQCPNSRGGIFNSNASTTYVNNGIYSLYIEENLNFTGNAEFGYDTVGLGFAGEGGPTLDHQIVGNLGVKGFWNGHFGIHPKTTNFTDYNQNVPSFMSTLKAQRLIPSVSWGFTQGAAYRMYPSCYGSI
jgi:Eukaryotic aspartyl protease